MVNLTDPLDNNGKSEEMLEQSQEEMSEEQTQIEGETSDKNETPERIPIDDELRKKLKIPAKFKYLDDVVNWGANAEKEMSRVKTELSQYVKQIEEKEALLQELEKQMEEKEQKKEITSEEREQIIAKFHEDWATDPIGTLNKLFDAFEKRLTEKQKMAERYEKWAKEEERLKSNYENWDTEIRPALAKIAAERPYLQSIEEVLAIYEIQRKANERAAETENNRKKTEKTSAFSESSGGAAPISKSIMDKINSANSLEELEALAAKIK